MRIGSTGLTLQVIGAGETTALHGGTVLLSQVHGAEIIMNPIQGQEGDGMLLPMEGRLPGLRVADCLPVFAIWDGFIGAAHAGWRGLAGGIVENLISSVDRPLRYLITGPCICPACYTVGEDVRSAVAATDPAGLQGHPPGRVDLRGSAVRRACRLAGSRFEILQDPRCTFEDPGLHSYRRNGTGKRNIVQLAENPHDLHIRPPEHCSIYHAPRGE